jgi:hypothetical protein
MNRESVKTAIQSDILGYYSHFVPNIKPNGKDLLAHCPFHQDDNPSLKINSDDGRFHCFPCGAGGDAFTFYGKLKGLDPKTDFPRILEEVGELLGVPDEKNRTTWRTVGTFIFRGPDGEPVYLKERQENGQTKNGKPGKRFQFFHHLDGKRLSGRPGDPLPYRLPELAQDDTVFFVEGEGKAALLAGWGLTATSLDIGSTIPSGEALEKWRGTYLKYFRGKASLIILSDNDDPGRRYAEFIASELKPLVGSVKVVALPGLPLKGDVIDWAKAGGTKEKLLELVAQAPEWAPDDRPFLKTWGEIFNSVIEVEYLVDRLLPKNAITVLFGRGGIGKTWLAMDLARCIGGGLPFLGLDTKKTPVIYIDFENPIAVLNNRTQKLGEAEGVFFWLANDEIKKAPKLDSPDWELYKTLPHGSVLIFDTLRASQSKDEDKSMDMANVLGRLKELRDLGFTIMLLHHTAKNNDRVAKGSTAIVDLADHILGLTLVKKKADGKDQVLDDDEEQDDAVYRFGWREKTRFEPFHLYLTLNPDRGFDLAPDPQDQTMETMASILGTQTMIKSDFVKACHDSMRTGEKKLRRLIDLGNGRFWNVEKTKKNNATYISPKTGSAISNFKSTSSSSATGFAKPDNDSDNQPINKITFGTTGEHLCQTAKLNPLEGVV